MEDFARVAAIGMVFEGVIVMGQSYSGKLAKEFGQGLQAMAEPPKGKGVQRLTYTHEAMIDLILQEPTVNIAELSELFGFSTGWISRVIGSDSFKARLAERKAVLIDPHIAQQLNDRFSGVAIQAVEIIQKKLDTEQSAMFAIEALGVASGMLNVRKGQ